MEIEESGAEATQEERLSSTVVEEAEELTFTVVSLLNFLSPVLMFRRVDSGFRAKRLDAKVALLVAAGGGEDVWRRGGGVQRELLPGYGDAGGACAVGWERAVS